MFFCTIFGWMVRMCTMILAILRDCWWMWLSYLCGSRYVWLNNNNKWNHMNAFAPPTMASVIGAHCPYFSHCNVLYSDPRKTRIWWIECFAFWLSVPLHICIDIAPKRSIHSLKSIRHKRRTECKTLRILSFSLNSMSKYIELASAKIRYVELGFSLLPSGISCKYTAFFHSSQEEST